ncbi:MAG: type II toxin-antitoxin system HicA family toxin [Ignavibacteriales bacterium]|nr:type II toxin-antitoxin system HicA family toxin [Ignavibacteriales bacterium]
MDIEKLIIKLKRSRLPISLAEFNKAAQHFGYSIDHIRGSHHVFRNWTGRKFVVPVHNNKIKAVYARIFIEEQE